MVALSWWLCAAATLAVVVADEEWSWGAAKGTEGTVKGTEGRHGGRRGRQYDPDRLVFQDSHETAPRGARFEERHEAPRYHVSAKPSGGIEVFSSKSPEVVNVPISVTVGNSGKTERKLEEVAPGSSEGRFFHMEKRLCKMGIGFGCKHKYKSMGKTRYVNLDHIPYAPQTLHHQPIHPPRYHPAPHPAGSYGSAIKQSDVFHVQPVALQAVGSPIQAVPLGPSGGQVPHRGSFGHAGTYAAGALPYSVPQQASYPPAQPSYQPPTPTYEAPRPAYQAPLPTPYQTTVNHQPTEYRKDGTIVQHIHKHTHIYKGEKPSRESFYNQGSAHRPVREHSSVSSFGHHTNSLHQSAGYRESCDCVSRYQCADYDVVGRTHSGGLLDARNGNGGVYSNNTVTEGSTEGPVRSKRDVDADEDDKIVKRDTLAFADTEQRQSRGYTPGVGGCHRGDVCCRSSGRSDTAGPKTFTCGRRHATGVIGRVKTPHYETGDTEFGEYPWQAAILKREGNDMVYVCGASLVDDRHVVTAAHCVKKLRALDLQVRLGEWDVAKDDEFYPNVDFSVDSKIVHGDYYANMLHNDIALLKLDQYVDFQRYPHISPVCLPEPHSNFAGKTCHVTGWGKDAFGSGGAFQKILKKVEVPVVRHRQCEDALRNTRLGRGFKLQEGMSCAGGEEGKDACKGDGGGPMVCRGRGGQYELAGVVSWGIGCGERGVPGVYVDVAHYVDWIYEHTRN